MSLRKVCSKCGEPSPLNLRGGHDTFHWTRFWTRWIDGQAIPVPRSMFLGVAGRKIGLFPVSPSVHWQWITWLHRVEFSDALVFVVVCDNLGDPLPRFC